MTLRLIGAGFGRTATLSAKHALERIGLERCYHMLEVFEHPQHAQVWLDAARGKPVDWKTLLEGYQATVDWPGCVFWRELWEVFPDADILLTARDPERWYESFEATIGGAFRRGPQSAPAGQEPNPMFGMLNAVVGERSFGGRTSEREHMIECYERHVEDVRSSVPPDRLLVWEASQGWGPLCEFVGAPVPDEAFPRLNDRAAFGARFGRPPNDAT